MIAYAPNGVFALCAELGLKESVRMLKSTLPLLFLPRANHQVWVSGPDPLSLVSHSSST